MYKEIKYMSTLDKKEYFLHLTSLSEENEKEFTRKDETIKETQLRIVKQLLSDKRLSTLK